MIKVGLTLPTYRRLADPEHIVATAELAETYGFHSLWCVDHVVIPESQVSAVKDGRGGLGAVHYESLTTLAYVAGRTKSVQLGMSIMPIPYRHPLLQAKSVATLDQLSGGRAHYGGAAGYLEGEFNALGADFEHRGAMADEYLRAIKIAWTEDVPEMHGRFVDFAGIRCDPKPLQRPHPPIWVGGDSDAAFRRVARHGDGWHGQLTSGPRLEDYARRISRLREVASAEGRDPRTIRISLKANCLFTDVDRAEDRDRAFVGTAEKIAGDLERAYALGIELIVFGPNVARGAERMDTIDKLGQRVLPRLVD